MGIGPLCQLGGDNQLMGTGPLCQLGGTQKGARCSDANPACLSVFIKLSVKTTDFYRTLKQCEKMWGKKALFLFILN